MQFILSLLPDPETIDMLVEESMPGSSDGWWPSSRS